MEKIILVDEQDKEIGTIEKMEAHEKALLHRAFSVFIFNSQGLMLLQQRAFSKYHSGGLWTNACCSHPRAGEETADAAKRRLQEEMGFTTPIQKIFDFVYKAPFANGLTEHEFDHVFAGIYNGTVHKCDDEVEDYTWQPMEVILQHTSQHPAQYTAWFLIAFPKVYQWWQRNHTNLTA